jgi:hypothetical protein
VRVRKCGSLGLRFCRLGQAVIPAAQDEHGIVGHPSAFMMVRLLLGYGMAVWIGDFACGETGGD